MCNGLIEAGGQLRWVYDPDAEKVAQFCRRYPGVQAAPAEEAVLADDRVRLVAGAAIPALRAGLGLRVMARGGHHRGAGGELRAYRTPRLRGLRRCRGGP